MYESAAEYRWENRLILVNSEKDSLYKNQVELATDNQMTFSERKLKVMKIAAKHKLIKDYPGRSVFLIGLDGEVKKAQESIFEMNKLIEIVDSMPMRANEINNKEKL